MTIVEAAERLGVSAQTLRIQAARGKLRASKHGPIYWVEDTEVERYRREHLGKRRAKG